MRSGGWAHRAPCAPPKRASRPSGRRPSTSSPGRGELEQDAAAATTELEHPAARPLRNRPVEADVVERHALAHVDLVPARDAIVVVGGMLEANHAMPIRSLYMAAWRAAQLRHVNSASAAGRSALERVARPVRDNNSMMGAAIEATSSAMRARAGRRSEAASSVARADADASGEQRLDELDRGAADADQRIDAEGAPRRSASASSRCSRTGHRAERMQDRRATAAGAPSPPSTSRLHSGTARRTCG